MKTFRIGYIFLTFLAFAVVSCEEPEIVKLNSTATIEAAASETEVVLTKEQEGTDVLTISWDKPDFGFSASPAYFIYLDNTSDFSSPISLNNGAALSKTFKSEELNKHLINLEFEPGVASTLFVRVEAMLTSDTRIQSEPISIEATAYTAYLDLSTTWGVVGSGYNNWGAFPDAPFFMSKTPNEIVAYVKLLTGEIKFRENNDWTNNLGDTGGDGTLEPGGDNIPVTAGYYKITFNTATNTYSIVPFTWGIVGSAYNNWGATPDFPFTYDDATDQWRALVKLSEGEFKIRKNNDWAVNYGDTGGNGTLESGGDNIAVTAGNYQITFNENDLTIEIVPIDNIWGLVGSAYNDWGSGGPDAPFDRDWRNEGVYILKNVALSAGEFKFRANNDWGLNYGDTGGNGTLEQNGDNIPALAGYYTITLDFSNPSSPVWSKVKH